MKQNNSQRNGEDEAASSDAGATGTSADEIADADAVMQNGTEAAGSASEVQEIRDRHLRLAAEYDNYRKRTERERGESWLRAQAQLVERLLDPLDDLQRVADYDAEQTPAASLLEGVQLVERKLMRALEAAGLEPIDAAGQPFDPGVHEAIATTEAESPEQDDEVAQVFQNGYTFKGVLLRPARVQVRKYNG